MIITSQLIIAFLSKFPAAGHDQAQMVVRAVMHRHALMTVNRTQGPEAKRKGLKWGKSPCLWASQVRDMVFLISLPFLE
jgi:hypothetical protein